MQSNDAKWYRLIRVAELLVRVISMTDENEEKSMFIVGLAVLFLSRILGQIE